METSFCEGLVIPTPMDLQGGEIEKRAEISCFVFLRFI